MAFKVLETFPGITQSKVFVEKLCILAENSVLLKKTNNCDKTTPDGRRKK